MTLNGIGYLDPAVASRDVLISDITRRFVNGITQVILVRAGLGSGKSALGALLASDWASWAPSQIVDLSSWDADTTDFAEFWMAQTGAPMRQDLTVSSDKPRLFVIDEIAKTYGNSVVKLSSVQHFWGCIKALTGQNAPKNIYVLMLGAYRLSPDDAAFGSTPIDFASSNVLGTADLAMSDADADEIVEQHNIAVGYKINHVTAKVKLALLNRSGRRIGLFRALLINIYERFGVGKASGASEAELLNYLVSWDSVADLRNYRALKLPPVNTEATDVLRRMVMTYPAQLDASQLRTPAQQATVAMLQKAGYVEDANRAGGTATQLQFTNELVYYILLERFFGSVPSASASVPTSLIELLERCVATMYGDDFQRTLSFTKKTGVPLERVHQMELYR